MVLVDWHKHEQSIISIIEKMREKGKPKFSFHLVTLSSSIKKVALLSDRKSLSGFRDSY